MSEKIKIPNNYKQHIVAAAIALLWWAVSFVTDTKLFTSDPLNMNCLPMDYDATTLMHVLCKLVMLFATFGIAEFVLYATKHKKLLFAFAGFFLCYMILLLCNYPGYYMSDDVVIFSYATRYLPVYWHNYLTSLYYMVGMSMFPASTGPIILQDVCLAMTFSYIYQQCNDRFTTKLKQISILLGLLPFVLLSGLMCFRPALYSPAFLFYFAFLYFEKKKHATLSLPKLIMLAFLTGILCFWRSEGIVLLPFSLLLIPLCYGFQFKKLCIYMLLFVTFFVSIRLPQTAGEKKYYGSDYLIISTVRPLSLIIHREQTYAGADEDWDNIAQIIDLGYLHYETLSCSSYNRYNADCNQGSFTQTQADEATQKAYIKSAINLIAHNLDLYARERIQLFLVTNGFYNYNPELVLGLAPVETSDFTLYTQDRAYGYTLVNGNSRLGYIAGDAVAKGLFTFGGEAFIPMLLLAFVGIVYSFIKKNWFFCLAFLSLLGREGVIFLTAPASFIQYSYPTMFTTAFLCLMLLLSSFEKKACQTAQNQESGFSL